MVPPSSVAAREAAAAAAATAVSHHHHQHRRRRPRHPHHQPGSLALLLGCSLLLLLLLELPSAAAYLLPTTAANSPSSARSRPLARSLRASASNDGDREGPSSPVPPQQQPSSRRQALEEAGALAALLLGTATGLPNAAQALEPLEMQSYVEQLREAMPVKTIRGIWRIREYRDGATLCKGRLKMKGFVEEPNKGTLEYSGCDEQKGRGRWLLKPARIVDGQIQFSARWKVRFADGDALIYRGDVSAGGNYAKATATITQGEILKPVTGITGNLTERKIGTFEADLIEPSDDEEKL